MTELLPCPFCGAEPQQIADGCLHWVHCPSCLADGPCDEDSSIAVGGWNTRFLAGAKNLSSDSFASIEAPKPGD